jgi:UDP-N-acetylmuramate: L-alanyl-gamma-D-glutamyl-meso-diaminopimelate ligase
MNYLNPDMLSPSLNRVPDEVHHIHLMGICGTGMASLAGMLKEKGYRVTGSDQNIYPPMSLFLESLSIPVLKGYGGSNLTPRPELVVVGNVITRNNPEAVELARLGIPYVSFPQAIKHFAIREKRTIVISGTHGKTTTSSLVAWILERAGMHPGFMIGGIPQNFQRNFKADEGPYFVVEGDEYDTAFFDKGPKFLHYRPWIALLTSIEYDHADIYRDLDHVKASFTKLMEIMPAEGLVIANGDDPVIAELTPQARCPVVTYGFSEDVLFRATDISVREDLTRLRILRSNKEYLRPSTPLYGRHNLANLLSAIVVADFLGIPFDPLLQALREFKGVVRRLEIIGEKHGILVLDDFAHHPTAVQETIHAVREKHGSRRLIAVFEPRSNSSRRNVFQDRYATSFHGADLVMVPEPPMMEKIPLAERFSSENLVKSLIKDGLQAFYFPSTHRLLDGLVKAARPGDVILVMSNGAFDDLPRRLLKRL